MAAAGIGNSAGAVWVADFGVPKIISGQVRNEIVSGGVYVFGSAAADVVSSGADSFANSDLLFTRDASGAQFNGICLQTTAVSGEIAVITEGVLLLVANGTVTAGFQQMVDGNNSVQDAGSVASNLAAMRTIGRSLTTATSGGFALVHVR